MAEQDVRFTCKNSDCGMVNKVRLDTSLVGRQKILMYCCNCGVVNMPQSVEKKNNENWLPCIIFDGIEKDLPTGFVKSATGERWTDVNGKHLTRAEFAQLHGVDPWTIFCSAERNKDKDICRNYPNRCQEKRRIILNPKTDSDVPSDRL